MYFQECFAEYMDSMKLAAYDVAKLGLTWLTSDVKIKYFAPMPFWREAVEMRVWVRGAGAVRLFIDFEAIYKKNIIAKGSSVQLIADLKNRHPQRITEIANKFEKEPECALGESPFQKIRIPAGEKTQTTQVVRFDDLDFNMHLNNVKYVPRALESIPLEYRHRHKLLSYQIKFMHETFFNNTVLSEAYRDGDQFFHRLSRVEDGVELCEMESDWIETNE